MNREETGNTRSRFDAAVRRVLGELRFALADVVSQLPGPISNATALQRALNIDTKLAWKVFRIVDTPDPLALAHLVPGAGAMRRFLTTAGRSGVSHAALDRAARAADDFEQLVETHAGDRSSFDAMISNWSTDARASMDLNYKRAAFRSNSYFYGIQASTQLNCCVVHPSDKEDFADVAIIRGFLGLRRLRTHTPCVVAHARTTDDQGTPRNVNRQPLDPRAVDSQGIALLPDFCSHPLPEFRTVDAGDGFLHGELIGDAVGNTAAVTCITGEVTRAAGTRWATEQDREFGMCAIVRIPTTVLILDLLVREGTFGAFVPELTVFGEHVEAPPFPSRLKQRDRLDLLESVVYLGKGLSVLSTREVPRYSEMAGFAMNRLGWNGERFDVYRCRIEYPVMPSTVVLRFELSTRR